MEQRLVSVTSSPVLDVMMTFGGSNVPSLTVWDPFFDSDFEPKHIFLIPIESRGFVSVREFENRRITTLCYICFRSEGCTGLCSKQSMSSGNSQQLDRISIGQKKGDVPPEAVSGRSQPCR
jgi:hypothetical protein